MPVVAGGHLSDCLSVLQNVDKFKSQMNSLAYGNAMMAAARDYQQVGSCCPPHGTLHLARAVWLV